MEVLFVIIFGLFIVSGVYLLLWVRIFLVVFGFMLIFYVVNLFLFVMGWFGGSVVVIGIFGEYGDLLL